MLRKGDPWHASGWNFTRFWTWWAQMMHKHSQEMSEAFFAGCCQARQFKGHAPTSTHGELRKNASKFAELGRLGAAWSWLHGTWWAPKGPKQVHSENGLLEMMVDLPLGKIGKGIGLGELQKGPSFFLPGGPWNEQSWTIWGAAFLTKWNETLGIFQKQHLDEETRMTSLILSIFRFPTFFLKSKPKIPRVR